jgi:hypothetical protein
MMSLFLRILFLLIAATATASAAVIDTIEFDIDRVVFDYSNNSIKYVGLDRLRDSNKPPLPIMQVYYHTAEELIGIPILVNVIRADTIYTGFDPEISETDRITSDFQLAVVQPEILGKGSTCYPVEPIKVFTEKRALNSIFSVSVFPIQYLDNQRIVVNRSIEISTHSIRDEAIILNGLPPRGSDFDQQKGFSRFKTATPGNGCPLGNEYIIVTSLHLEEAFASFLDLKLRTGFDAAIAITDSIYASYDGSDEAASVRNYLRDFYNSGGRYVLLGGDEDNVPIRYSYHYNTEFTPEPDHLMICDLYFADYDGDWDMDGDGIWGEPTQDHPDNGPEVALGRLPFSQPDQVTAYTANLKAYLFHPGNGEIGHLNRSLFFTSDQMRDYFEGGQQYRVAESFPEQFSADCERLAESPTGNDPSPNGPFAPDAIEGLSDGYGIVNILAHGRPDGFVVSSSGYNNHPKSYLLTGTGHVGHAGFEEITPNQRTAFYYSISCSQGAFDLETVFSMPVPSVVEELLSMDSKGAMGMVAFSRWGWVGSSYKLMASFYDHLFSDADGYPVEAMYLSWLDYPYYRDQIYGQNYYGDPSIRIYTQLPSRVEIDAPSNYEPGETVDCFITLDDNPLSNHPVMLKLGEDVYIRQLTNGHGRFTYSIPEGFDQTVEIVAMMAGNISASSTMNLSIAADADDEDMPLPCRFDMSQNYPNPFNPETIIGFTIAREGMVALSIYDILGRLVCTPVNEHLAAGEHEAIWGGTDRFGRTVASGIYIYRLVSEEGSISKKMTLVK